MSYLEEVLPEFRKGAKIRRKCWEDGIFHTIIGRSEIFYNLKDANADDWEFYQEPIDWDYIIKNKCLCRFWDDDKYKSIEKLACINDKADYPFENIRGEMYRHCHPVLKDEVTFYEDKNNE